MGSQMADTVQSFPVRKFEKTRIYPGYQFCADFSMPGEDALTVFRFVVLTVQKWIDERIQSDVITDPLTFRTASEKDFLSYVLDENAFVLNVTYLDETHEWAARLRETDSFVTDDKAGEGRVFITRIAVRPISDDRVRVGCKIDVIESDRMTPFKYAFRPKFIRWLFSPADLATDCPLKTVVCQGAHLLSMGYEDLNSKTSINELKNFWKTDENSLPFVIFTEAPKQPAIQKESPKKSLFSLSSRNDQPEEEVYDAQKTAARYAKSNFAYARTFFVPAAMIGHLKTTFQLSKSEPGSVIVIDPKIYANYRSAAEASTYYAPSDVLKQPFYEKLREGVKTHGVRKSISFDPLVWEKDLVIKKNELKLKHTVETATADSIEDLTIRNNEYLATIEQNNASIRFLQEENKRLDRANALLTADATHIAKAALDEKDSEILALTDEVEQDEKAIEALRHEINRLEAENKGLRTKLDQIDNPPVLFYGDERDKFSGEIKDIILSVLIDTLKKLPEDCRRADVLRDVVSKNQYEHILEDHSTELKVKLTGYTTMTAPLQSFLEEIGLSIVADTNHYKLLYFGDSRYATVLPKTASDRGHGDLNAALEIIRKMM